MCIYIYAYGCLNESKLVGIFIGGHEIIFGRCWCGLLGDVYMNGIFLAVGSVGFSFGINDGA